MNILGKLLENPNELLTIVVSLIEDEKKRISDNKLANGEQWGSSIQPVMKAIGKNAEEHRKWNVVIGQLSGLHNILKSIKLPGDFEKHSEEKFYIALDLPYDGEKFHDLSSLPKKEDKEDTDCPECEKEEKEEDCVDCAEDGENVQDILADVVNKHLRKIAEVLGDKGDHEAAYLVERTMRSISREANGEKLFGKVGQQMDQNRFKELWNAGVGQTPPAPAQQQAPAQPVAPQATPPKAGPGNVDLQSLKKEVPAPTQPAQQRQPLTPQQLNQTVVGLTQEYTQKTRKPLNQMQRSRMTSLLNYYYKQTGNLNSATQKTKQRLGL